MIRRPLDRRAFLKSASLGLFAVSSGGIPAFLPRLVSVAGADSPSQRRRTLVCIFQRGAMDGLMAVCPLDDSGLQSLRPRLAMSSSGNEPERLKVLGDSGYGLHPAFNALKPMFDDDVLAVVHGVGSPNPTRSHFDAQDFMETGTPHDKGTPTGWLNRALVQSGSARTPFQAVALTPQLPRSLYGELPALAVSDLRNLTLGQDTEEVLASPTARALAALYRESDQATIQAAGQDAFSAMQTLRQLDVAGYQPSVEYPRNELGRTLSQTALLIKSQVGLEVAFCEQDGWDTHVQQGRSRGQFAQRARELAEAMAAFWQDLSAYRDDVVVLTMTEFGRTVHENGSGGTDHGRGSCLFVLGSGVAGGQVLGTLPPLRREELADGRDLPVTTDFRGVFASVARAHLGVGDVSTLFPGYEGTLSPVMRG